MNKHRLKLTKKELVERISDDTGLVQADVEKVVKQLLHSVGGSLARGDAVELRNFGVFKVRLTKRRIGRNPPEPEVELEIGPRAVVKFESGRELRKRMEANRGLVSEDPGEEKVP